MAYVLVVDDDAEVNTCLSLRLEAAGFEVLSALDGEAGLSAALKYEPDAILLDVQMPKMDGLTLLQELRSNKTTVKIPIVMLSASIREQHHAIEAGANYFIAKPYDAESVLSALDMSMREECFN